VKERAVYSRQEKDSEIKEYYPDGKIQSEKTIKNGTPFGHWKFYHENGNMSADETYSEGKLSHKVTYDTHGKKLTDQPYLQNLTHGVVKAYFPDGQLNRETTYKLGKKTGPFISYHQNGTISLKGEYLKDQEIGIWEHFNENGELLKKITYQRGKVVDEEIVR
jgi:antitoxin component YwqK of YwqJK toxin-antitoxin module